MKLPAPKRPVRKHYVQCFAIFAVPDDKNKLRDRFDNWGNKKAKLLLQIVTEREVEEWVNQQQYSQPS